MSGNIAATRGAATARPLDILLWCVQAFLALVFVSASWAKLMGKPEMVALFMPVGFGQWFRYVTGILELTGAVLIMVPKTRRSGSALLATIMVGAFTAHRFILRSTHYTGRPVSYVRLRRVGTAATFPAS